MAATRVILILVAASLALPLAGATHGGVHTYCTGGEADVSFFPVADGYHVRSSDGAIWQDTNGLEGIQTTARVCTVYDSTHRAVGGPYVDRPADSEAFEGVTLPRTPPVPDCIPTLRICIV